MSEEIISTKVSEPRCWPVTRGSTKGNFKFFKINFIYWNIGISNSGHYGWNTMYKICHKYNISYNAISPSLIPVISLSPLIVSASGSNAIAKRSGNKLYVPLWRGSNPSIDNDPGNGGFIKHTYPADEVITQLEPLQNIQNILPLNPG